MAQEAGAALLQLAAERIIIRYVRGNGFGDAAPVAARGRNLAGAPVDVTYRFQGRNWRIKLKPDPYFGTDLPMIYDRDLPFYRATSQSYAFEAIANPITQEPGWMFHSDADELYYYYLALPQDEEAIAALLGERDEVFFGELEVERDELRVLPMKATQEWFTANFERYTPRPVTIGDHSAWYRLVPHEDLARAVPGIKTVGPVFARLPK